MSKYQDELAAKTVDEVQAEKAAKEKEIKEVRAVVKKEHINQQRAQEAVQSKIDEQKEAKPLFQVRDNSRTEAQHAANDEKVRAAIELGYDTYETVGEAIGMTPHGVFRHCRRMEIKLKNFDEMDDEMFSMGAPKKFK